MRHKVRNARVWLRWSRTYHSRLWPFSAGLMIGLVLMAWVSYI